MVFLGKFSCNLRIGQSKNTYGTGLFLIANIGKKLRIVEDGLLTSVLYQKDSMS